MTSAWWGVACLLAAGSCSDGSRGAGAPGAAADASGSTASVSTASVSTASVSNEGASKEGAASAAGRNSSSAAQVAAASSANSPSATAANGAFAGAPSSNVASNVTASGIAVDDLASLRAELDVRDAQIRELKHELGLEQQRRYDREHQWLEYNRWLAHLPLGEAGRNLVFPLDPSVIPPESQKSASKPESKPAPSAPAPELVRAAELVARINSLLWSDGVRDLSLLEGGRVGPELGAPRWIGPVVLRRVDGEGRLSGSLYAERMHLECSRAARTVTLVLEDGYEQVDGARSAFEPVGRRILLPLVDPDRWLEGCAVLFAPDQQLASRDDGLWDKQRVERALNALLRADAAAGYFEVQDIGGIVGNELRDVRLIALDRAGRAQRYVFCDSLRIRATTSGIELALKDGAVVREGRKSPFPEGRMRIVLPRASADSFASARIPGFADPDLLPGMTLRDADAERAASADPAASSSRAPGTNAAPSSSPARHSSAQQPRDAGNGGG